MEKNSLNIYCDGGSRGNPGLAAIGVVIKNHQNKTLFEISKQIGETTNNVAEYTAVSEALEFLKLKQLKIEQINFYLDSLVVNNQLSGIYKIKQPHLQDLYFKIQNLINDLKIKVSFTHIKRELNFRADFLVNLAFDQPAK